MKTNRLKQKGIALLVLVAVILVAFGIRNLLSARAQGGGMKTPRGAVVSLSTDKATFAAAEDIILHLNITNPTSHSIRLLKWFTPLEGVEGPLFTVLRNGEPATYLGMMVKRAAPTDRDYMSLTAGEGLTCEVNLSDYYDLSVSGNYRVMYDVTSNQLYGEKENEQLHNDRLTSNTLSIFIH